VKPIILLNPSAGRRRARKRFERALRALREAGIEPLIHESHGPRHLCELARQAREEGADLVVSAGGDGTHHYVLNGLAGGAVPLGLLSIGSGNDFAKGLGIPVEPRAAVQTLLQGEARLVDLVSVRKLEDRESTDQPAVYGCMAGTGFDSIVTRFANERVRWVHGSPAYAWAILRCLKYYRPHWLEIESDTYEYSGEAIFVTVGNTRSYGGGVTMAPRARFDDGLLDVCVVGAMSKLELLRWVPAAYRGEHLRNRRIAYFQASKVTLRSPSRLELFGDGEYINDLPVMLEVLPGALRVLVPRHEEGLGRTT
jgi:diacylglycerol kinase (ATP)